MNVYICVCKYVCMYVCMYIIMVSRQLVYGHFVYDTSSTDISTTMTFLAQIEAGVMKRKLCQ